MPSCAACFATATMLYAAARAADADNGAAARASECRATAAVRGRAAGLRRPQRATGPAAARRYSVSPHDKTLDGRSRTEVSHIRELSADLSALRVIVEMSMGSCLGYQLVALLS